MFVPPSDSLNGLFSCPWFCDPTRRFFFYLDSRGGYPACGSPLVDPFGAFSYSLLTPPPCLLNQHSGINSSSASGRLTIFGLLPGSILLCSGQFSFSSGLAVNRGNRPGPNPPMLYSSRESLSFALCAMALFFYPRVVGNFTDSVLIFLFPPQRPHHVALPETPWRVADVCFLGHLFLRSLSGSACPPQFCSWARAGFRSESLPPVSDFGLFVSCVPRSHPPC